MESDKIRKEQGKVLALNKSNHSIAEGQLCPDDLEKLRAWSAAGLKEMTPRALAPKGVEDLRGIARRLKDTFPELLNMDLRRIAKSDFKVRMNGLTVI